MVAEMWTRIKHIEGSHASVFLPLSGQRAAATLHPYRPESLHGAAPVGTPAVPAESTLPGLDGKVTRGVATLCYIVYTHTPFTVNAEQTAVFIVFLTSGP